jgi:hypothetical protein
VEGPLAVGGIENLQRLAGSVHILQRRWLLRSWLACRKGLASILQHNVSTPHQRQLPHPHPLRLRDGTSSRFPPASAVPPTWPSTTFTMNIPTIQTILCHLLLNPRRPPKKSATCTTRSNKVAVDTKVDHRFILAIILQESSGCPPPPAPQPPPPPPASRTPRPHARPQRHQQLQPRRQGAEPLPCPASKIEAMVRDGTAGTEGGDGLAGIINQVGGGGANTVQVYYEAARYYNAGRLSGQVGAIWARRARRGALPVTLRIG